MLFAISSVATGAGGGWVGVHWGIDGEGGVGNSGVGGNSGGGGGAGAIVGGQEWGWGVFSL